MVADEAVDGAVEGVGLLVDLLGDLVAGVLGRVGRGGVQLDQRVVDLLVDGELSIGDFVLGGGEVAAMAVVEAVARLVPGVMGNEASAGDESFTSGLLEYPQYTRPEEFRGMRVPSVLLSGNHGEVERWRRREALRRTLQRRPDLLESAPLSDQDRATLDQLGSAAPTTEP